MKVLNVGFQIDPLDAEALPAMKENFLSRNWKKISLKEADSASAFTQFLRAGVQSITNTMYQATATTYEDWVTVIQSNKDTELYAPNQGVGFPRQVGRTNSILKWVLLRLISSLRTTSSAISMRLV